jgi:hypothetical protein
MRVCNREMAADSEESMLQVEAEVDGWGGKVFWRCEKR